MTPLTPAMQEIVDIMAQGFLALGRLAPTVIACHVRKHHVYELDVDPDPAITRQRLAAIGATCAAGVPDLGPLTHCYFAAEAHGEPGHVPLLQVSGWHDGNGESFGEYRVLRVLHPDAGPLALEPYDAPVQEDGLLSALLLAYRAAVRKLPH